MNTCYQKSTLDCANNASQTVATGANINLGTNNISTGVSISHQNNTDTVNLTRCGIYLVSFNADVVQGSSGGTVQANLFRNGVFVVGGQSTAVSTSATDIETISFVKLISVQPTCPCSDNAVTAIPLTFVNNGISATYSNVNVVVVKLA